MICLFLTSCKKQSNDINVVQFNAIGFNQHAYINNKEVDLNVNYTAKRGDFVRITATGNDTLIANVKIIVNSIVVDEHECPANLSSTYRIE
jgi:hypothetical protein